MTHYQTPGVYLTEPPAGTSIIGAPTDIAAFVGWTASGPLNQAVRIFSWADYERTFGGSDGGDLGRAVWCFFQNGGGDAWVIRVTGADGGRPEAANLVGDLVARTGFHVLEAVDLFNQLCLPDLRLFPPPGHAVVASAASAYCQTRRALLLVDLPASLTDASHRFDEALHWIKTQAAGALGPAAINAAAWWPEPLILDPQNPDQPGAVGVCGVMAGLFAASDAQQGVWKAPAGTTLPVCDGAGVSVPLTDDQMAQIVLLGLNPIRYLPGSGVVAWGARTLGCAQSSDWTYIPVRRLALYLENSLYHGLKWAAFEPNSPPLWSQITLDVTAFMHTLYAQGAFFGDTPAQAFWVRCDATTTSFEDMAAGVVNLQIGFAATAPAEFIVLSLQVSALVAD